MPICLKITDDYKIKCSEWLSLEYARGKSFFFFVYFCIFQVFRSYNVLILQLEITFILKKIFTPFHPIILLLRFLSWGNDLSLHLLL